MFIRIFILIIFISCLSCGKSDTNGTNSKTTAGQVDTCDNPDADINCSFIGMPENLSSIITIADVNEKGERMIIKGQILKGNVAFPDVIIYAYHTDNTGEYTKSGNEKGVQKWHGRLHAWGKTDKDGRYEIHSIKPVMYPSNNTPAHIHWIIKKPDGTMMYLNDFVFEGDPFVNEQYRSSLREPGDNGVIKLTKNSSGVLEGERVTNLD